MGVNHLSMLRLNLKLKIFTATLLGDYWRVSHFSMSRLNLKFKISLRLCSAIMGVNHLSMLRLNLKFKIFTATLVIF